AIGVENVEATGAAAIDVTGGIDLHAIRPARLGPAQVGENPAGLAGEQTVRQEVEGTDVAGPRLAKVEHLLIGRERKSVWPDEVIDQERQRSAIGGNAIDAVEGEVVLPGRPGHDRAGPGIGEINRTI